MTGVMVDGADVVVAEPLVLPDDVSFHWLSTGVAVNAGSSETSPFATASASAGETVILLVAADSVEGIAYV